MSVTDDDNKGGGVPHLAERLNALFERVPQPGTTRLYNNQSAAKAISATGVSLTGTHLSLLRSGKRNNPSARLLAAIADLFDVPITYFFDAELAQKIIHDLDLLAGLRDTQVRAILARAADLNDRHNVDLQALLDQINRLEGSDNDAERNPRAE